MAGIDYRYELWSGEEVVATGRLNYQQPLEVGDGIEIGGRHGIVSTIEPVLREHELRLVVEQLRDPSQPVSQSGTPSRRPVGARATSVRPCGRQTHESHEPQVAKALQTRRFSPLR